MKELTITIEAGLGHVFPFDVDCDDVVTYRFKSSDDIYFSVGYEDNKSNRHLTWTKEGSGAFLCTRRGKVMFEFDNSKSWIRGTTLTLAIEVEHPLKSGLEKPICFQVPASKVFTADIEKKLLRIPSPPNVTTRDILASGRRLLAFDSSGDCRALTGRTIDFSLNQDATDDELISKLNNDTRAFLAGRMNNRKPPKLVLGTMTFDDVNDEIASDIVKAYADAGPECDEIDTAYAYGKSEAVLGRIFVPKYPKMMIATKVNPWPHSGKSFSPDDIRTQINTSFKNLGVKKVDILYLHQPDANTPLEVTLETMDALHKKGLFRELGLSNFAAWQVVLVYHLCREKGWIVPTVYQGMYNVLTRDVEPELFPALRAHNIRFYAYNPLAGGLLTGRYNSVDDIPKYGRFARNTTIGKRYIDRFWHESYFEAMKCFRDACQEASITPMDAAFRWLAYHSLLDTSRGDTVILGASSLNHMNTNLNSFKNGQPLPQIVINAADKAWDICRGDCPRYFRK